MTKTKTRRYYHERIFYLLTLCIAFFIPVYDKLLPWLVSLLVLNWLVEGRYVKTIPRLLREKRRLRVISFALIYLLYLVGMLYSSNLDYGWFDLEVKAPLLDCLLPQVPLCCSILP
ncbi:MAG: hypothetical protein NTX61_04725 [Bacteroidetes bacterium]|nr:hypothetical protein [Bacteroidota bacterium]